MAATASRKVQREIEIAEKKVNDGVREFSELWRKVEEAQVSDCKVLGRAKRRAVLVALIHMLCVVMRGQEDIVLDIKACQASCYSACAFVILGAAGGVWLEAI